MTLRQPSMLAAMSIPPTTNQVQGPAIHMQGLEKSYKELRVLRGVDFQRTGVGRPLPAGTGVPAAA